jgi:hypothetical protein
LLDCRGTTVCTDEWEAQPAGMRSESQCQVLDNPALLEKVLVTLPGAWRLGAVCRTWRSATRDLNRLVVFRCTRDPWQIRWCKERLRDGWDVYCDGDVGVEALSEVRGPAGICLA